MKKPKFKIGDVFTFRYSPSQYKRQIVSISFNSQGNPVYTYTHNADYYQFVEIGQDNSSALYINNEPVQLILDLGFPVL